MTTPVPTTAEAPPSPTAPGPTRLPERPDRQRSYSNVDFLRFLLCRPFYWMLAFLIVEAALAAATTALIIKAGHDVADQEFLISDFVWIVLASRYLIWWGRPVGFLPNGRVLALMAVTCCDLRATTGAKPRCWATRPSAIMWSRF